MDVIKYGVGFIKYGTGYVYGQLIGAGMLLEAGLYDYLINYAALKAKVENRVYPVNMPQNVVYPAITYERISGSHVQSHQGPSGLAHPRIQFTCWAEKYSDAKELAEILRRALDGYRGQFAGDSGVRVDGALLQNDIDYYDPETKLYAVVSDFFIWHAEEKE